MTDMSAPLQPELEGSFRIGQVLSRALSITSRNLVKFSILVGIPFLPYLIFFPSMMGPKPNLNGAGATLGLSVILSVVLGVISQAVVIYAAFQDMRGRSATIGESLQKGLARFWPIVGLALAIGFGILLGFILLVVPGFILYSMWFVALPACVVESLPPFRSLGRSAELTKGHRWATFGLFLLLAVISGILGGIVGALFSAIGGTIIAIIARFIFQAVFGAFQATVVVVAYHDLRVAKEGVDVDRIAAVFD